MKDQTKMKRIIPEYSKNDFIKGVWKKIANDDVPLDVFKSNLEFETEELQILSEDASAKVSYLVSIGYSKTTPYVDIETYYEDEPFTDYEYYSKDGEKKARPIVTYRSVEKQRQVIDYQEEINWVPFSGTQKVHSTAIVECKSLVSFDKNFSEILKSVPSKNIVDLSDNQELGCHISKQLQTQLAQLHRENFESDIELFLPGDCYDDMIFTSIENESKKATIYLIPEYYAKLEYNGQQYIQWALPFGSMTVEGDTIENSKVPQKIKQKYETIEKESEVEINTRFEERKSIIKKFGWILLLCCPLLFGLILGIANASLPFLKLILLSALTCLAYKLISHFAIQRIESKTHALITDNHKQIAEKIELECQKYEVEKNAALSEKLNSL